MIRMMAFPNPIASMTWTPCSRFPPAFTNSHPTYAFAGWCVAYGDLGDILGNSEGRPRWLGFQSSSVQSTKSQSVGRHVLMKVILEQPEDAAVESVP